MWLYPKKYSGKTAYRLIGLMFVLMFTSHTSHSKECGSPGDQNDKELAVLADGELVLNPNFNGSDFFVGFLTYLQPRQIFVKRPILWRDDVSIQHSETRSNSLSDAGNRTLELTLRELLNTTGLRRKRSIDESDIVIEGILPRSESQETPSNSVDSFLKYNKNIKDGDFYEGYDFGKIKRILKSGATLFFQLFTNHQIDRATGFLVFDVCGDIKFAACEYPLPAPQELRILFQTECAFRVFGVPYNIDPGEDPVIGRRNLTDVSIDQIKISPIMNKILTQMYRSKSFPAGN